MAVKQTIIRDRVIRLEDRMYRLIEKLKETEPDQARRLEQALRQMSDLGIKWDLDRIVDSLDEDALNEAASNQQLLIDDLEQILGWLVTGDDDAEARRQELERLKQLAAELDELIAAESRLQNESQNASQDQSGRQSDPDARAAIESLRNAQRALRQDTAASQQQQDGAQSADELAQRQEQLAEQAEELAEMLEEKQESGALDATQAAHRSMQAAVEELDGKALITAGDEQEDALTELERALAQLSKEPTEEESLKLKELSKEQENLRQQTDAMAERMQSDSNPQGQTTPGQPNVDQAEDYMEQARRRLDEDSPDAASTEQQKAINELNRAKQQVQQRIEQLKQQQREQKLALLKKLLDDMLTQQQAINRATSALAQIEAQDWKRPQQLQATEQSSTQRDLAAVADEALAILNEDGSTTIFPKLLEQVREDMLMVSAWLGDFKVGVTTRQMQADIVEMIQDLLEGIERTQAQGQPGSQNPQQASDGQPPLLPTSAELKLLAKLQQRVFDRTRNHFVGQRDNQPYVQRLAEKQKEVAVMAQEMTRKQQSGPRFEQGDSDSAGDHP